MILKTEKQRVLESAHLKIICLIMDVLLTNKI